MLRLRKPTLAVLTLTAILAILAGVAAQQPGGGKGKGKKRPEFKSSSGNEVIQEFPSNGSMETAWKVHWATTRGHGLYIQDAFYKKGPGEPWMQVLGDARLSEMFVPYHVGSPRFWDVSYNFEMTTVTRDDAGPFGKLLGGGEGKRPNVVQEVRDRGIMFMSENTVRRGQTLVLFGTLLAANYRYIIEYGFQDNGVITFRVGSCGRNYGGREFTGHMHNGLWRIDVNLDGPENNSVYLVEHIEPDINHKEKTQARSDVTPFNNGKEGFADFKPEKFTMLRVINDKRVNARKQPLAYDLMTFRSGNARHFGGEKSEKENGFSKEMCTRHDFWVTKAKNTELNYTQLPKYVADGEPVLKSDVVLWLSTPMHHEPRSEDGQFIKGQFLGTTHVGWAGFELRPRDLFDRTPMFDYSNVGGKK